MEVKRHQLYPFILAFLALGVSCNEGNKKSTAEDVLEISQDSVQQEENRLQETEDSFLGAEAENLIQITSPLPNAEISSPLEITGKARGPWYFEGDFPVLLFDENNNEIAVAIAIAQGAWMTEEWVEFKAQMEFEAPASGAGYLEFQKSNPSDKRELDSAFKVKVKF